MTKATHRSIRFQTVGVHHDRRLWQQVAGMAGGTVQARSREISKPSPVTHFSPASLYLLNLPKHHHQWGTKCSHLSPCGTFSEFRVCVEGTFSFRPPYVTLVGFPSWCIENIVLQDLLWHYEPSLSRCSHLRDVCLPFPPHAHCQSQIHSKGKENFREDPIRGESGSLIL